MTTGEAVHFIQSRLTYKPGVKISFQRQLTIEEVYDLRLLIMAINADRPYSTELSEIHGCYPITKVKLESMTSYDFAKWVYGMIAIFEEHERSEWLRVDGIPVVEPHPEILPWDERARTPMPPKQEIPKEDNSSLMDSLNYMYLLKRK